MTDAIRRSLESSGVITPLPEPPMYRMNWIECARNDLLDALAQKIDREIQGKRKRKEIYR